jgi:Heparinase II/III-like protein
MTAAIRSPFDLIADDLQRLLATTAPLMPELEAARGNLASLRAAPQARAVLAQTQPLMAAIAQIPQTSYSLYRLFARHGDRGRYETPYFLKRSNLAAAALRLFLDGQTGLRDCVQDYLWSVCEESNWVLPAHERDLIDLFAAETGFVLAETLHLLGAALDAEVRGRVRQEIERRIFDPYLRFHRSLHWYQGHHNWNSVCNSAVAATFLLLEPEPGRVARALELALAGLRAFLETAFEADGSSTEGVAYWHYGLINFVALAEMLRARSAGAIDLLASERMQRIAAYPAHMQLSGAWFASFSDCDETLSFNPGIVARLAERSGEASLLNLLARPAVPGGDWRLTMMLRNLLWWDGAQPVAAQIGDALLPAGGVARLVATTPAGAQVVLAVKAGHNAENHNQNDVGSFILHVDGENLLTDPGRGLYSRDYFGAQRYANIFANSYGHSVPRIGGQLQAAGHAFHGQLQEVETDGAFKRATVEFARAYPLDGLAYATRRLTLAADGVAWLQDDVACSDQPLPVEEALITWHDVEIDGATALVRGQRHTLRLTIEAPVEARFELERLEEQSRANAKPGILKRLRFVLPAAAEMQARVRMELRP